MPVLPIFSRNRPGDSGIDRESLTMLIRRKSIVLFMLAAFVTAAAACWVLLNPCDPLTRLFQREISDVDARIVIGPYPSEADFRLLKSNSVDLVVSLLDPVIPYEASLLQREQELARLPGDADALGGLGLTCWRANRLDEAARYLDAALKVTPDNRELLEILDRIRKAQAQG